MQNITRHYGVLKIIKRLKRSTNGNSRFLILVDGYRIQTPVDSSYCQHMSHFEGKKVIITAGSHYGKLTLDSLFLDQRESA